MQKFRKCFISLMLSYKVTKNTALLHCTANQVGTGHKLNFQPKHPARSKSTSKMADAQIRCDADGFGSISYHLYYHIRSGKIQLCSVVPPTKTAQAISFIFSPKIQLGPNWHQSTTKMAATGIRCDEYSFGSISYH